MMHVAAKGRLDQSLLGTRAGLLIRERWRIQKGKAIRRRTLRVKRTAVCGEWMEVRSALRMLNGNKMVKGGFEGGDHGKDVRKDVCEDS
jgi:hypothetical protein